jgi:hypothetical protein
MASATIVYDITNGASKPANVGDIVYQVTDAGHYKHTMHLVERIDVRRNLAVTYCNRWLFKAVASNPTDIAVWCENGCLQAKRAQMEAK